ncbi:MAG: sigma-54 dependent transcriptional regulator [Acidobacteriota bacterium]
MAVILVVEDNAKIQAHILSVLRDEGHDVTGMGSAEEALGFLTGDAGSKTDLLLLDIRLGGMSGVDLINRLGSSLLPPTIVVSGEATMAETIEALRLGVSDFVEKPFSDERLCISVNNCLERVALHKQLRQLQRQIQQGQVILGESRAIRAVIEKIQKLAATNARVLITGESGTGKELVATTLHQLSPRSDRPFIRINCAAFPVHLIEDELFGHVKGAFTDAHQHKTGLFEAANGGTLFLDEIGDMDYALQSRLLRVLDDGRLRRLGDTKDVQVDVRTLAATNCDLEQRVKQNRFREDLFYRLSTVPIHVPPLRERKEDIALLASYYVSHFCALHQIRQKQVEAAVLSQMELYAWPGNVRELKNLCERLVIFGGDPIAASDLPSDLFAPESQTECGVVRIPDVHPMPLRTFKSQCEKEYIEAMLQRMNWNYVKVAELLDIHRSYLHQKITGLGIQRRAGAE